MSARSYEEFSKEDLINWIELCQVSIDVYILDHEHCALYSVYGLLINFSEMKNNQLAALTQQKEKAEAKVSEAFIAGWNNYSDAFDHQPLTDEIGEHSLKMRLEAFLRGN